MTYEEDDLRYDIDNLVHDRIEILGCGRTHEVYADKVTDHFMEVIYPRIIESARTGILRVNRDATKSEYLVDLEEKAHEADLTTSSILPTPWFTKNTLMVKHQIEAADAEFIEAADPRQVRWMCARILELETQVAAARSIASDTTSRSSVTLTAVREALK